MNEVTVTLKGTVLEDIFVTALEGGSNYWYLIKDEDIDNVYKAIPEKGIPTSMRILSAVVNHGVVIPIYDVENPDDEPIGVLDATKFQERLQKCMDEEEWAIFEVIREEGDATSCDIIFQYLCLGEVVYG